MMESFLQQSGRQLYRQTLAGKGPPISVPSGCHSACMQQSCVDTAHMPRTTLYRHTGAGAPRWDSPLSLWEGLGVRLGATPGGECRCVERPLRAQQWPYQDTERSRAGCGPQQGELQPPSWAEGTGLEHGAPVC